MGSLGDMSYIRWEVKAYIGLDSLSGNGTLFHADSIKWQRHARGELEVSDASKVLYELVLYILETYFL